MCLLEHFPQEPSHMTQLWQNLNLVDFVQFGKENILLLII